MPVINPNRITQRDLLSLLLILFIAALLRFGEPGVVEFFHDEAMVALLAQDMAAGKTFPTVGILSSVGIPNPPTSIYVMWLPFALSSSPLFATLFIALLNVIGVGLLWLIAHRYFGRRIALIAGLVYALNPWAVLYSRKIWAQDFHTPFLLIALLLGLYGFLESDERYPRWKLAGQALCLPIFLFAFQIHFAAWVLLPVYFVILWLGRRQISWRTLLLTTALSLLVLLPYAVGLSQTLERDPERISNTLNRSGMSRGLSLSGDSLIYTARLATGLQLETWVAPEQQADLLEKVPRPSALWMLSGVAVLVGGFGLFAVRAYQRFALPILLWVGLPVVVFAPTWTPVYPHYFVASLPALALLAALGLEVVLHLFSSKSLTRPVILGAYAAILLTQGFWWRGVMRYVDTTYTPLGYTTPIHYLLAMREELASYEDVIVVSNGMWVLLHKDAARWPALLRDTAQCVRTLPGSGYALFPTGRFAVLTTHEAPESPVENLYTHEDARVYPIRPGNGVYTITSFDSAPSWPDGPLEHILPVLFDNGVRLTGYKLDANRMTLEWQLPAAGAVDYQYSGHFLNAEGDRLGQYDTSFLPGRHWCAGDRLITWADVAVPEGTSTLRVSMYRLGEGKTFGQFFSANILDVAGNPAGQWIDIPLTGS